MKVNINFFTATHKFTKEALQNFLFLIQEEFLMSAKYGSIEPLKESFSLSKINDIYQLVDDGLIIHDKKKSSYVFVKHHWGGICWWQMIWNEEIDEKKLSLIYKVFSQLYREQDLLYGNIRPEDEYQKKHVLIETFPEGGRVTKFRGASSRNFLQFLPGIYWFNFFGHHLTKHFYSKIKNDKNIKIIEFGEKALGVQLNIQLLEETIEERLDIENKIAHLLGEEHFFKLKKKEFIANHPAIFLVYINELKNIFFEMRK